jgi:hypothetical protein
LRKKHSFLLTLIAAESQEPKVQGRLEIISTGKTLNFSCLEELLSYIDQEMKPEGDLNSDNSVSHSRFQPG